MTARAKFLFDADFSAGAAARAAQATVSNAEHEAALAEAEARGYRNGISATEGRERADAERRLAEAFDRIAAGLDQVGQRLKAVEDKFEAEAVEVALAVGRKLAPALIAREPLAEITELADTCFRELIAAPHLVVRVNGSIYAATKERLEELAQARGFEGRLVIMAEAEIAPGDCRIEWADGGLKRERAATETAIAEAVERYVAVRRPSLDIPLEMPGEPNNGR